MPHGRPESPCNARPYLCAAGGKTTIVQFRSPTLKGSLMAKKKAQKSRRMSAKNSRRGHYGVTLIQPKAGDIFEDIPEDGLLDVTLNDDNLATYVRIDTYDDLNGPG